MNNFGYGGANAHVIVEDYKSYLTSTANGSSSILTNGTANGVNGGHATNGDAHSIPNGITNGHTDSHTDGLANGHTNGLVNGHTNGSVNGHADHLSNGHSNSKMNGHTNGVTNGLTSLNGFHQTTQSKIIVLSAKDEQATEAMGSRLKDYLEKTTIKDEEKFLNSLAYTLGQRRSTFPWIAAQPAQSVASLVKSIDFGKMKPERTGERPKLGFVFTGQGAQWYAMGRELMEAYPVYRDCLLEADEYLEEFGATWSVMGEFDP